MAEDNSSDKLKSEVDSLKEELAKIRTDLRDLANTATDLGKDSTRYAKEQISQNLNTCVGCVDEYMKKQPLATVAMAFGVGFVAAKIFGRRD